MKNLPQYTDPFIEHEPIAWYDKPLERRLYTTLKFKYIDNPCYKNISKFNRTVSSRNFRGLYCSDNNKR